MKLVDAHPNEGIEERLSLADALFTSTQQKVLGLLFGQPDRSFFVTQIMALANAGRGAVQRELHRLEASGLATVQMVPLPCSSEKAA